MGVTIKKTMLFPDCMGQLRQILMKLLDEYTIESALHIAYEQCLFSTLMIELARHSISNVRHFSSPQGHLGDIMRYITEHYADISLTSTAAHFGYHSAYLSSLIKKETGKSFKQPLTEYRLNRAIVALQDGDKTVEQIAFDSGYRELSTFYKAFTKRFGCPPRSLHATSHD